MADELANLPEQYQPVTVCIHHNDFRQGNHIPFQNKGLRIVSCGYKTDPLFLFRFYHLCSLHKYSSGNGLGSHVPYSIKAGCQYFHLNTHKASYKLSDNCQTENVNFGRLINIQIRAPDLLEDIENLSSNQKQQLQFADYYLGSKYLKSPQETNNLLDEAEYLYRQGVGRVFLPQTQWQSKEIKNNEENVKKSNVDLVIIYWSGNNKLLNIWLDNVKFLENCQLVIVTDGTNQEKDSIDLLKQFCLSNNISLIENQEYTNLVQAVIQAKQKFSNYKYAHIFKDSVKLLASPLETIKIASAKGLSFYGVIEKTFWGETYNNYWCLCLNIDLIFEKIKPHYAYNNNCYTITGFLQEMIDYGFNIQKSEILKNVMCEVFIPEQKYCETYWKHPNRAIEDRNIFF